MLRHLTPMFEVVADSPHANVQRMRRRSCPTRSNTEIAVRLGVVETSRYDVICQSAILCREETIHLPVSQPRLCMECHSQRRQCEPWAESASYIGYRSLCGLCICAHLALPQPRRAAQSTCSSNACEKELGRRFCHAPQTSHVGAMRSSGIYEAALSLQTDPGEHLALWARVM